MSLGETIRALREALALLDAGTSGAAQRLDRTLRHAVVTWIREPIADRDALEDALADALERAPASSEAPWHTRWATLMDLVRDAARMPSLAEELRAMKLPEEGSAAWRILYQLRAGPARNKDLAQALDMKASHVSNETKRLEQAGLVDRVPGGGRNRHVVLTPRGRDLLALLPPAPRPEPTQRQDNDPGAAFWNRNGWDEHVPSFR
jgi:DNA-binding MarR family transcriptional regulator